MKKLAAGLVVVVALLVAVSAQGQHHGGHGWHGGYHGGYRGGGHWRGGVIVGGPSWWGSPWPLYPYYPYYPYSYYPPYPPVVVDEGPQVYIQRPQEPEQRYWYYCRSAKAYYPAVRECPEEWIKVPPAPR